MVEKTDRPCLAASRAREGSGSGPGLIPPSCRVSARRPLRRQVGAPGGAEENTLIDFSKLAPSSGSTPGDVDPIKLFHSLTVADSNINDLWLAQGDALREWHANRAEGDVAVVLNTGAGKTLVGLLMAQSLVNETRRQVVYACASIQLIEQTAAKASGYGLDVTTYYKGDGRERSEFSNGLYRSGRAPCLTTYQALFNGKSRFRRDDVAAVIFDDGHAASHIIRDQYTLRIDRAFHRGTYDALVAAYRNYMVETHGEVAFDQAISAGDPRERWLIPPFANAGVAGEVKRSLLEGKLGDSVKTMFAWEHLCDHIDLCAVFVSGADVSFTPPVVPVRTLSYFQPGIRRIYLSATLAAGDVFLRTFGRRLTRVIAPRTTAGECERMVLFPQLFQDREEQGSHDLARAMIKDKKALVLVPTNREGEAWDAVVSSGLGDHAATQVETFKAMGPPACLRLVARYDGVDLPGDTCRLLVIDGLPSGMGPLEKFLWERLDIKKVLRSSIASRVVQSFGRISRGMSDYGVVVITGSQLVDWLQLPANQEALPPFLRSQIALGLAMSEGIDVGQGQQAPDLCLTRDAGWIGHHSSHVRSAGEIPLPVTDDAAYRAAEVEVEFGHLLWDRQPLDAAKVLHDGNESAFEFSPAFGAWLLMWEGFALSQAGDTDGAERLYRRARQAHRGIPAMPAAVGTPGPAVPYQIEEVVRFLYQRPDALDRFDRELAALSGNMTVPQTEEAVRCLGAYLGLASSRPEREHDTGPDNLWMVPEGRAWSMELKTDVRVRKKIKQSAA